MSLYLSLRNRISLSPIASSQLLRINCRTCCSIFFFLFQFVECLLGMFSNVILSNRGRCLWRFSGAPNNTEQHHCHANHNSSLMDPDHLRPLLSHPILLGHSLQMIPPAHQNTIPKFQSLTLRNRDGMLALPKKL